MSTDDRKKKIESLRESISRLETQKTLSKDKKAKEAIDRVIGSFELQIKKLKSL